MPEHKDGDPGRAAASQAGHSADPFLKRLASNGGPPVVPLPGDRLRMTIGRSTSADIRITHDPEVSRIHALLEYLGDAWFVVDDGMSSNGSYVNDERVPSRRRLAHRDKLRIGKTVLEYHDPTGKREGETQRGVDTMPHRLSERQRGVLVELCRPIAESGASIPASNREIAARLGLTEDAVRAHVRRLVEMFDLANLHPNEKRSRLAELVSYLGVPSAPDA